MFSCVAFVAMTRTTTLNSYHCVCVCLCCVVHSEIGGDIDIGWLIVVAMVWGCTTPLMKAGSAEYENVGDGIVAKLRFVVTHPRFTLPLLVNLSGSLLFYWSLSQSKLSLVVPVIKSLEFVFIALTSWYLGEVRLTPTFAAGMSLICAGVAVAAS